MLDRGLFSNMFRRVLVALQQANTVGSMLFRASPRAACCSHLDQVFPAQAIKIIYFLLVCCETPLIALLLIDSFFGS